jgi:glucosamine--fructose-6-phosphate aminotransferase (isomerizing)
MMRLMDETAATVDAMKNCASKRSRFIYAANRGDSLPWLAEDHPATDPITKLVPAYRMIEQTARTLGFDPDRPPRLCKVTETF